MGNVAYCVRCIVNPNTGLDGYCSRCRTEMVLPFAGLPSIAEGRAAPTQAQQALKDGGTRTSFSTGSQRDTQDGKPRPDLIPVRAQLRKAVIHMLGSIKYDERNWEKGQPQSQFLASALRHLYYWMMGDTSEDHLAQLGWNVDCMLDQEERCLDEKLPLDLLNLPHYNGATLSIEELPTRVFLDGDTKAAAKAAQMFRASVEAARQKVAQDKE